MTPRQIKEAFYLGARTNNYDLVMKAAKAFEAQGLWTSSPHWSPTPPDGTEVEIDAGEPGTCVICLEDFPAGIKIRWRSRVDCHKECWEEQFGVKA